MRGVPLRLFFVSRCVPGVPLNLSFVSGCVPFIKFFEWICAPFIEIMDVTLKLNFMSGACHFY